MMLSKLPSGLSESELGNTELFNRQSKAGQTSSQQGTSKFSSQDRLIKQCKNTTKTQEESARQSLKSNNAACC